MKLYRMMKVDAADGKPKIGTSFGTLGVRPPGRGAGRVADIEVDAAGSVRPGTEGMSTFDAPGTPDRKHVWWEIDDQDFGPDLIVVASPDTPGRYHITPGRIMSLDEYQDALADTRDNWTR